MNVSLPYRGSTGPLNLLIDSTGIKAEGEGEWNARKYGGSKRRVWRKIYIGIDEETLEIRAIEVTSITGRECPAFCVRVIWPMLHQRRSMTTMMISKDLLDELLSGVERPKDLLGDKGLMKELKIRLMKRMLGAELTEHLGYEPHGAPASQQANRRNGATRKVLKGHDGAVPIDIPRDRSSHRSCVSTAGQWIAVSSLS
jgi:hypothetical protein